MNLRDAFILEYGDLAEGETRAGQLCPSCNGGPYEKNTLSVSRTNGILLWHCHRDSCDFSGRYGGRFQPHNPRAKPARGMVGRTYVRNAEAIPEGEREYLSTKLLLNDRLIARAGLGWDTKTNRLVQPVFNYDGEVLGCCLRSLSGEEPKSKSHTEEGVMAWYMHRGSRQLIIVEDIFSAIRASEYMASVALLSTHLNDERVGQIRKAGFNEAFIALDRDAFAKSVKYASSFRSQLRLHPVQLSKDIKDMSHEEADELFEELEEN